MSEILAMIVSIAFFGFAMKCFRNHKKREQELLDREIANYWRLRGLHERREAAECLAFQRRTALAERCYREHGHYPGTSVH